MLKYTARPRHPSMAQPVGWVEMRLIMDSDFFQIAWLIWRLWILQIYCKTTCPGVVTTCPEAGQGVKILWRYKISYIFYKIILFSIQIGIQLYMQFTLCLRDFVVVHE